MKPLDPQIRRLLDEVTSGDAPPADLEDQLWQQLAPRLGGALPPTAAAASSALATKSSAFLAASPLLKLSLGALIAGAGVTAVVQHRSAAPAHEASLAVAATQAPARDTEAERAINTRAAAFSGTRESATAGAQPDVPAAQAGANGSDPSARSSQMPSANGREHAASASASTLVAETQLLARAQRALRNGKPAAALPLIEQHAATYPNGALAQERDAARVLSLCALKRYDEARRSQQQFLKTWPGSPLTERIQRACPLRTAKP